MEGLAATLGLEPLPPASCRTGLEAVESTRGFQSGPTSPYTPATGGTAGFNQVGPASLQLRPPLPAGS